MPKRTKTSKFGVSKRESHDSSAYYRRRLNEAPEPATLDAALPDETGPGDWMDRVYGQSAEKLPLPDSSVALAFTSPPYNVGKEYDVDATLVEYLGLIRAVGTEVYRVLKPGGRYVVNIANLGRKPYIPLHSFIIQEMLNIGFLMRGEIIWNKGNSSSPSTAWGSWLSPANPTLRDVHEYILVFSKGSFGRQKPTNRHSTISKEEFLDFTKSLWTLYAESAKKIGHPAPFPIELPYRLIQLYTFNDEVILDPFMGSGQTAIAALLSKRHYIGYETNIKYIKSAENRIEALRAELLNPSITVKGG